jgi:hypothetical protein
MSCDSQNILEAIFTHFDEILLNFSQDEKAKDGMDEIFKTVVRLEKEYGAESLTCRLYQRIVRAHQFLPEYFNSDEIYEQCALNLLKRLFDV